MGKGRNTIAAGVGAAVVQPGGLRKVLAVAGVLVLAVLLIGGALLGALLWMGTRPPEALPCAAERPVRIAWNRGTAPVSESVREAVLAVLRDSGRKGTTVPWDGNPDLTVIGSATGPVSADRIAQLRVPAKATATQIRTALSERGLLTDCATEASQESTPVPSTTAPAAPKWPWLGRGVLVTAPLLTLAVWWTAGPVLLRLLGDLLWGVRLSWRYAERTAWRLRRRAGLATWTDPAQRPARGERWHMDPTGMKSHLGPRAQDRAAGRRYEPAVASVARLLRQAASSAREALHRARPEPPADPTPTPEPTREMEPVR